MFLTTQIFQNTNPAALQVSINNFLTLQQITVYKIYNISYSIDRSGATVTYSALITYLP